MIAQNIAHAAVLAGTHVLFTTAAQLLLDLGGQDSTRGLARRLTYYATRGLYLRRLGPDAALELRIEHRAAPCPPPLRLHLRVDDAGPALRARFVCDDAAPPDPLRERALSLVHQAKPTPLSTT